ncbi:MAG: HNH endonuclease [Cetobacterium sp.]
MKSKHLTNNAQRRVLHNQPRKRKETGEPAFCHYCECKLGRRGDTARTTDHIVPLGLGGKDFDWNKVVACRRCNMSKADKWPECKCEACKKSVEIHWKAHKIGPPRKYLY